MLHFPVYLMCVALLACGRASAEDTEPASGGTGFYTPRARNELTGPMDFNALNYFLPRLAAKYKPSGQWNGITEPEYFLDTSGVVEQEPEERYKRAGNGLSLSINNPLEVLREQLQRAMKLRQTLKSQKQGMENRKLMDTIGKRGTFLRQPEPYYTI